MHELPWYIILLYAHIPLYNQAQTPHQIEYSLYIYNYIVYHR